MNDYDENIAKPKQQRMKRDPIKIAEEKYLQASEKVEKLKADLEVAKKDQEEKRKAFLQSQKDTAISEIKKALFSEKQSVSIDDINEIIDFIKLQNEEKAKKVVTNDNFLKNEEIKNENPIEKIENENKN